MNWLSAMNSNAIGSMGGLSMGMSFGGVAGYGDSMGMAAFGISGSPWSSGNTSNFLMGGLVGSTLGGYAGMYGGGFGNAFGGTLQNSFQQQPMMPPYASSMMGYGSSMGMGYGSSMGMGYGNYDFGGSSSYGGGSYGFEGYGGTSSPYMQENPYQRGDSAFPNFNGGTLSQDGQGQPISYETSGGYKVSVNGTTVTVTDPNGKNEISEWGDPHENVNGQKADDWSGTSRTLLLGDGTKVTMSATAANSTINSTSIYDGSQEVQIDNTNNQVTKVSNNPYQTRQDERTQVDGDTAYFGMNRSGSEVFKNLYTQNSDYTVTRNHQQLATLNQPFS